MFCKQKIIVLHGNYSTDPNNVSSEVKSHIFSIGSGQCTFATFPRNCTICTHTHTQMLPYKIYALMNDFDDICIYERYESESVTSALEPAPLRQLNQRRTKAGVFSIRQQKAIFVIYVVTCECVYKQQPTNKSIFP